MEKGFTNRRDWTTLTLAMTVWLAHFTLLWIASVYDLLRNLRF